MTCMVYVCQELYMYVAVYTTHEQECSGDYNTYPGQKKPLSTSYPPCYLSLFLCHNHLLTTSADHPKSSEGDN